VEGTEAAGGGAAAGGGGDRTVSQRSTWRRARDSRELLRPPLSCELDRSSFLVVTQSLSRRERIDTRLLSAEPLVRARFNLQGVWDMTVASSLLHVVIIIKLVVACSTARVAGPRSHYSCADRSTLR